MSFDFFGGMLGEEAKKKCVEVFFPSRTFLFHHFVFFFLTCFICSFNLIDTLQIIFFCQLFH